MTARIIIFGKNKELPSTIARSCEGGLMAKETRRTPFLVSTGAAAGPIIPLRGPAASLRHPRMDPSPARGTLARSQIGNAAPLFDATEDRWIVPPSTTMVDTGAAAEPRHLVETHDEYFHPKPARPAVIQPAAGLFHAAVEVFTVALGLTVFGLIAGFLLVLA